MMVRKDTRHWANADAKPFEQLSFKARNLSAAPRSEQQTDSSKRHSQELPRGAGR